MIFVLRCLGAALVALGLAAPAAQAERATATVHDGYQGMESRLSGGGSYVLYAGLHQIGDRAAVCGLIWYGDGAKATAKATERKLSAAVQYHVDGRPLTAYSNDFKRYDSEDEALAARKAGCTVTRTLWSDIRDPRSFKLKFRSSSTFVD